MTESEQLPRKASTGIVKLDTCKLRTAGPLSIFRFLCLELNVDPDDLPFDLFEHQGEVVENMRKNVEGICNDTN